LLPRIGEQQNNHRVHLALCAAPPNPRSVSHANRSPGSASSYLDTFPFIKQWYVRPFVCLTVTGIAQDFHPIPSMRSIGTFRCISVCLFSCQDYTAAKLWCQYHTLLALSQEFCYLKNSFYRRLIL